MVRTDDNPDGLPIDTFDAIRAGERADRSQLYRDLADGPFFGHNRTHDVDQGFRDAFWLQSMSCGHRAALECIAAFSATDFRSDLAAVDVPTLVIHGDDDQIVPFEVGGKRSAALIDGARLTVYEGSGHALPDTDRQRLHADLLTFIDD
jgi:non-heme chloroperoxidase